MKAPKFEREAELCAAFIAWAKRERPDIRCYAEWAGWDILLVYPEGWQLGVQAKLRLNADVILQATPDRWTEGYSGPDYRSILVPARNGWSALAARLGLVIFTPQSDYYGSRGIEFTPELRSHWNRAYQLPEHKLPAGDWQDWNPAKRHELPPVDSTDAVAGSPCPVSLTPWKLRALDVLAELKTKGVITAKRIRELGIDPGRWTQSWLQPGEKRGLWVLSPRCPRFDEQHPTAFAAAMGKVR